MKSFFETCVEFIFSYMTLLKYELKLCCYRQNMYSLKSFIYDGAQNKINTIIEFLSRPSELRK